MKTIEVTKNDIEESYKDSRYNPLERAASRELKMDLERTEVRRDHVYVWLYDDSDYMLYKYDEESYVKVYDFLNEWQLVVEGMTDEDGAFPFEGDLISFNIEEEDDTRTHSNNWHGASLDFSGITDDSNSHKKNLKFRLTDDDY
jgi:hypothetical protein